MLNYPDYEEDLDEPPIYDDGDYDEYERDLDDYLVATSDEDWPDIGSFYDPWNNPEEDM